jgi:hypothetical protein
VDFAYADKTTSNMISALTALRSKPENVALRRGSQIVLKEGVPPSGYPNYVKDPGIYAFIRSTGTASENIYVFFNTDTSEISGESVTVSSYASNGTVLKEIYPGTASELTVASGSVSVDVPALSLKIYRQQ